jgi:predicted phosphohydrolase
VQFVTISDTHGQHEKLRLPAGDVLIHAGDISSKGKEDEAEIFLDWFAAQPHPHKIFIAGNHDFFFERAQPEHIRNIIPPNIIYLNDSGITLNGFRIWGSPISPWFFNWAFNRHRGEAIRKHWELIPAGTDILITHGPVHNILDTTLDGTHAGCADLREKVLAIRPKVFICGHIHEAAGTLTEENILFINASVLNERYQLAHAPVVFEL